MNHSEGEKVVLLVFAFTVECLVTLESSQEVRSVVSIHVRSGGVKNAIERWKAVASTP